VDRPLAGEIDTAAAPPAVELRNLSFSYAGGRRTLIDINASVSGGCRLAVIGPSGAGKSTLLMHLNGLLPSPPVSAIDCCQVWIHGQPVLQNNLRSIRRHVGFVFQDPDDQLFGSSVEDDVAFGPRQLGCDWETTRQRVRARLVDVGLGDLGPQNPGQLSYGERKRVCLAGVLACDPEVLILDEPSSNLDPRARRQLVGILSGLPATQVIATHDLDLVLDLCDRVLLLDHGQIQADGPPRRVLSDPLLMDRHGLEVPWRLRAAPM
jgi:cobalt/nickel transport system ATP-binding protein